MNNNDSMKEADIDWTKESLFIPNDYSPNGIRFSLTDLEDWANIMQEKGYRSVEMIVMYDPIGVEGVYLEPEK